ncbi:major facilitator superfamily domain-containing protein [Sphaerosporella brunnea]|uniref:Major facilitator superfamily domain-containing protein n=1 Tax=Sphaerosporella brunnea TaxID=1250544 RepID=A0A5J5EJU3_9PEZI|nr:major facilitator superfamily domain-containing protein [Sphaerosporella brunnea]
MTDEVRARETYQQALRVIQCLPNTYPVLIVGQMITGLGFGCVYVAANLYVAECAPANGYQVGALIAFWSGYGMSFHTSPFTIAWRVLKLIQLPLGLAFFFFFSDSLEVALRTLAKLRSGSPDSEHVQAEFPELQVGGIAALTMYAVLIYKSLGWDSGSQALATNGIQSVLQLFIVLVSTFAVDRFGRKTLQMAGFAIQSTALLILSSLTTSFPINKYLAAVIEIAMLFIVGLTYCWSNRPIAPHVRDKAFGLSMLGQTPCLLALTQPWPRFTERVGPKSYWLLFSLNVAALASVWEILPEIKAISLERMGKLFGELDFMDEGEKEMIGMKAWQLVQVESAKGD